MSEFDLSLFESSNVRFDARAIGLTDATPEAIPSILDTLGQTALEDLKTNKELSPMVVLISNNGKPIVMEGKIHEDREEKDLVLAVWLRAIESCAKAMFTVLHAIGHRADDAAKVQHEYLMTSASLRDDNGNVRCWASMTELPSESLSEVKEVTEHLLRDGLIGGPSLNSLPDFIPTGQERAEARKRLSHAMKRIAKGKRPFTEVMHEKIGW